MPPAYIFFLCVGSLSQVGADGVECVLCVIIILFRKPMLYVDGSEHELCVSTCLSGLSVC